MVAVTMITNGGEKNDIVPESMTPRQIYEKMHVNYQASVNMVNSSPVRPGDLDKSLREMNITDSARFSSIVKMDNAAEIIVAGTCAIVKSGEKLENWEKCLKYQENMGLYNEDGSPDFLAAIEEGPGSINSHGVVWSDVPTEDGYACVTTILDPTVKDKKELVKEEMGKDLLKLNALENTLSEIRAKAIEADALIESKVKMV